MSTPLVFLWLSPLFGLSLQLDSSTDALVVPASVVAADMASVDESASESTTSDGEPTVAELMARRERVGRIHRAMGIATWGAMTLSVISGVLQYRNLYGFFSPSSETPCVTGEVRSLRTCTGQPIFHATSTAITALLYYTTFGLSYAMPDPIGLDRGDSLSARRLRRHKRLRWVHFSGMAAQALLGIFVANAERFGALDRTNDFRTLQALATVHMGIGLVTYGALTWAGGTMIRH